jgi:hypothetical protein
MIAPAQIPNPYVKPKWQAPVGVMESVVSYNCRKYGMPRPILAMPMWEGAGNRTMDYSGHGHHGTLKNGPVWVGSKMGVGLDFIGVNEYVNIDLGTDLDNMTAMTVSARVKVDRNDISMNIISKWNYAVPQDLGWTLHHSSVSSSWRVEWAYDDTNNTDSITAGPSPIVAQNWYHVAAVWAPTSRNLYIDGDPGTANTNTRTSISDTTANLIIASQADYENFMNGKIDDIIIFDTTLTESQVKFLSDNPYFMYRLPEELYGYAVSAGISMPLLIQQMNQFDGGTYALC